MNKFDETNRGELDPEWDGEPVAPDSTASAELRSLTAGIHDTHSYDEIHGLLGQSNVSAHSSAGSDEYSQQSPYEDPVFEPDPPEDAETASEAPLDEAEDDPAVLRQIVREITLLRRALDRDTGAATLLVRTMDEDLRQFHHLVSSMQSRLEIPRNEPLEQTALQSALVQLSAHSQALAARAASLETQLDELRAAVSRPAAPDSPLLLELQQDLRAHVAAVDARSERTESRLASMEGALTTGRPGDETAAATLDDELRRRLAGLEEQLRAATSAGDVDAESIGRAVETSVALAIEPFLARSDNTANAATEERLIQLQDDLRHWFQALDERQTPSVSAGEGALLGERLADSVEARVARALEPLMPTLQSLQGVSQRFDQSLLENSQRIEGLQRAISALVDTSPDVRPLAQALKVITERVNALHTEVGEPLGALRELLFDAEEAHGNRLSGLEQRLAALVVLHEEVSGQLTGLEGAFRASAEPPPRTLENAFFALALFLLLVNIAMNVFVKFF